VTLVVKVGGHALDDLGATSGVLRDLAADVGELRRAGEHVVLVHGGGPQIAELLTVAGRESRFVDGLRVTDETTMRFVAMALSEVNLRVVTALNHAGLAAVGLSGADATLLTSTSLGEPWVRAGGAPLVRAGVVHTLVEGGFVPVVCSVAVDENGELLNCNADAAAGALAGALDAERLVLLSDIDQIRRDADDPASAITALTRSDLRALIDSGAARDGMRPKAEAALAALEGGARSVTVANGGRAHALAGALKRHIPTTEVTQ
jgi:acetylglutamate kinase